MKNVLASLILLPLLLLSQPSAPRYAAPYGVGTGTADDPMSLQAALSDGGLIWLLPGRYKGTWLINQSNTTLRSVPGTRAILDGDVQIWGENAELRDLEITYTDWTSRTSAYAGSQPPDIPSQKGLSIFGKGARILHCVIHDTPGGIGWWQPSSNSEMAYNLIYNAGWKGVDRGHAPGIYANNRDGEKYIHDNVILPGYSGFTFQLYGSPAAFIRGFRLERNIHIGGRWLAGGEGTTDAITATGNLLWNTTMQLGYTNPANGRAIVQNNYIGMGRLQVANWKELSITNNTIINQGIGPTQALVTLIKNTQPYTYTWDANTYFHNGPYHNAEMLIDGVASYSVPSWKAATGWDGGSSYAPTLPTANAIFVRSWGAHRGVVVVYNWQNSTSVSPDLSSLSLTSGAAYKLVNAQNPTEVLPFTAGQPITVPMHSWSVAAPYAASAPLATFDSRFGVFLVMPE